MAEFDASAAIWSSGDNPSVCHRQPPAEAEVMTRSELDYCGVPVPDGGGICSTADWFQPRVKDDLFRDLRRRFESLAMEWRLVPRLMAHVSNPTDAELLSAEEVLHLREEIVGFLRNHGFSCNGDVEPNQPFLLSVWQASAKMTVDVAPHLPNILSKGVPTGIESPISPSGVWDAVDFDGMAPEPELVPCDLLVHLEPWRSAAEDLPLAKQLLQKDIDAGCLMHLRGGEAEAKERWGDKIAAGKLGLVKIPGKKPRLIGDATVSGANSRCVILEKIRLPTLSCVQRVASATPLDKLFSAFSFDIRGAHKLIRVRPAEQGYSTFVLDGEWYTYRTCFFGCRWAAYWFSRASSFLVRLLHRWVWIPHALWVYVDDGLLLLPADVAPLVATTSLMFLLSIGMPISWEKLQLGTAISWIGWDFHFSNATVCLPNAKKQKLQQLLSCLMVENRRVERKLVEQAIGLLLWYCGGASWLKPWLQCLYNLLFKPLCVFRALLPAQFECMRGSLDPNLRLKHSFSQWDLQQGWKLHSVSNCAVRALSDVPLQTPRLKRGAIDCVFYDYSSAKVRTNKISIDAATLFFNAVSVQKPLPLRCTQVEHGFGAADAFADSSSCGVGGWWCPSHVAPSPQTVLWFSIQFRAKDLPAWLQSENLQSFITSFEALAQLLLLLGRLRHFTHPGNATVVLQQLCDNNGVVALTRKQLTMKAPMCYVLQAIGFYCCQHGVSLSSQHCAGVRNEWADALSRGCYENFNAANRMEFDVCSILEKPWNGAGHTACGKL